MNDERAQRLRRLSKGIQEKTISDADILAAAMDARLAKRKTLESTQNEVNQPNKQSKKYHFDRDVVDAATKENIQNIPSYPASPYRALEGFVELEHKQKRTQQVQENMKKLKTTAAATATTTTTTASSSAVPTLVSSPINTTFNSEPIVVQMIIPEVSIPETSSSSYVPAPIVNASTSSSSSTPKETFSAVQLRKLMLDHLLNIINNGNYEELTSLKGIAKVRAMKIFTKRNAGYVFDCMEDLDCIGMNNKNIEKFVIENLGFMLGKI